MKKINHEFCEMFNQVINSEDFIRLIQYNGISSVNDVLIAQNNQLDYLLNITYLYLKSVMNSSNLIGDLYHILSCEGEQAQISELENMIKNRLLQQGVPEKDINSILFNRIIENRLYIHATNPVDIKKIREEGLSTERRSWNSDELKKVVEIYQNKGKTPPVGYILQDNGLIYFSRNFIYSTSYAYSSPEWVHIYFGDSYIHRDYQRARNKFDMFSRDFNDIEKNRLERFFNNLWNLYATCENSPNLVLVEGEYLDLKDKDTHVDIKEGLEDNGSLIQSIYQRFYQITSNISNESCKTDVPKEAIGIIALPNINAYSFQASATLNPEERTK